MIDNFHKASLLHFSVYDTNATLTEKNPNLQSIVNGNMTILCVCACACVGAWVCVCVCVCVCVLIWSLCFPS